MHLISEHGGWDIETLNIVEGALSKHKIFGNSSYIHERMAYTFGRRLDIIGESLPSARKLRNDFDCADPELRRRVIGDTVLRSAIKCAHTQVSTKEEQGLPLGICDSLFCLASDHLQSEGEGYLLDRGRTPMPRIGAASHHGAIWCETDWDTWLWHANKDADLYSRALRYVINEHELGPLAIVDQGDIERARIGQQLVESIVPNLGASASSHVNTIGLFDPVGRRRGVASSSQFRLSGTIFINKKMFKNPWEAAEHIFHESLHQKLYDIRTGHTILSETFDEDNERRVISYWNPPGLAQENRWNTHRAMAAFHVYVHLALMARIAEVRKDELEHQYGSKKGMIDSRVALDRAQHLGQELRNKCEDELGYAGKAMLDWMINVLDIIDGQPERRKLRSHLFLNRFANEGKRASSLLDRIPAAELIIAPVLERIAVQEISRFHELVLGMRGEAAAERFANAVRMSGDQLGMRFAEIRENVVSAIYEEFDDENGVGLADLDRDGRIERLVEHGSSSLLPLLRTLPDRVVEAKRRAFEHQFNKSCRDEIGRLLAMLAAGSPKNGRILEIGTGAGVGLAWAISGLRDRTDVEVVSIESDERLFESVRNAGWPKFVKFCNGPAEHLIPDLGLFDLIFVDASPMKFDEIELTIKALRNRGALLLDDLIDKSLPSRGLQFGDSKQEYLKQYLECHPNMQYVFIDWSSGVAMAVKIND
jgi:predicted O-methyltransferase YrrM